MSTTEAPAPPADTPPGGPRAMFAILYDYLASRSIVELTISRVEPVPEADQPGMLHVAVVPRPNAEGESKVLCLPFQLTETPEVLDAGFAPLLETWSGDRLTLQAQDDQRRAEEAALAAAEEAERKARSASRSKRTPAPPPPPRAPEPLPLFEAAGAKADGPAAPAGT